MGYILMTSNPLITPSPSSSPPPSPSHKPPPRMLYYSIVLAATAAIVLGIYNLIIIRLCTIQYRRRLQQQAHRRQYYIETSNNTMSPSPRGGSTVRLISSFKYKRAADGGRKDCQLEYEMECAVCLSGLEEGEEVKRLPMCHHCFHASCIDMWLYSHIHCPLCRAAVVEPPPPPPQTSPGTSSNVIEVR